MLTKRKGQSIVEYVLIFGVVTAGALASFAAISGGGGGQQAFENYVTGQSSGPQAAGSGPQIPSGGSSNSGNSPGPMTRSAN
jgi:hypothetical protein